VGEGVRVGDAQNRLSAWQDGGVRVRFIGGTRFVGPVAVAGLVEAGHEVAVAHSGALEPPGLAAVQHLHGPRDDLLADGGAVEKWRPEAIVDTFTGGATARKARALAACAKRAGAEHLIVTSSMDVYQHCVDAGLADGSQALAVPGDAIPLPETATLRLEPYPGAEPGHDNVEMEAALHDGGHVTALRCGAIYGPHPSVREWSLVEGVARGERRLDG
jgi:nucleoside-diphosphate-sugar epimerase